MLMPIAQFFFRHRENKNESWKKEKESDDRSEDTKKKTLKLQAAI
jgi:hypothetical protein